MSDPTHPAPRYQVVVHEIRDGHQTTIMDATASGFIAAAASIQHSEIDVALADGGPHTLKAHIALFITNQYPAEPHPPTPPGYPMPDPANSIPSTKLSWRRRLERHERLGTRR